MLIRFEGSYISWIIGLGSWSQQRFKLEIIALRIKVWARSPHRTHCFGRLPWLVFSNARFDSLSLICVLIVYNFTIFKLHGATLAYLATLRFGFAPSEVLRLAWVYDGPLAPIHIYSGISPVLVQSADCVPNRWVNPFLLSLWGCWRRHVKLLCPTFYDKLVSNHWTYWILRVEGTSKTDISSWSWFFRTFWTLSQRSYSSFNNLNIELITRTSYIFESTVRWLLPRISMRASHFKSLCIICEFLVHVLIMLFQVLLFHSCIICRVRNVLLKWSGWAVWNVHLKWSLINWLPASTLRSNRHSGFML
jgi:hypothetical protein